MGIRHVASRVALGVATVLVLTGCGGDTTADTATTETTAMGTEAEEHATFAFGEPGDPATADRTVAVVAKAPFMFEPSEVTVSAGETVTFEITNSDTITHDFFLGDEAAQDDHEAEMREMDDATEMGDMSHEDPNAVTLPAGETVSITWTFADGATIQYGCHQPGHYAAGMHGDVVVEG